jgi:DNA-directed RNA polymerase specialized sigma24 family protein
LCELYWYPLYAYVRRHGYSPDDVADLTQAFFTSLLERRDFEQLTRERGRFRAFLLASLKHFLANDFARRRTLKRGSGVAPVSFRSITPRSAMRVNPPMSRRPRRSMNVAGHSR